VEEGKWKIENGEIEIRKWENLTAFEGPVSVWLVRELVEMEDGEKDLRFVICDLHQQPATINK
jgi:hypothetical protein